VPDLPLTGGCLCGAVRFEVTEQLVAASYCHCTRCQRRTGSAAAVSARVVPGSLRIVSGEGLLASYDPPDGFKKVFCSGCGGALWAQNPTDPAMVFVRLGTFDGDPGIRPSYRQFVAYAAPWEAIPDDGLPRHPERAPG
jgi:hypothetical protein